MDKKQKPSNAPATGSASPVVMGMSPTSEEMSLSLTAPTKTPREVKESIVASSADTMTEVRKFAQFRGRPMVMEPWPYPHYVPLYKDKFEAIAYPILGGVTRSRINDVFAYLSNVTEDLTDYDHLILFGMEDAGDDGFYYNAATTRVWDMRTLAFHDTAADAQKAVWRSPYGVVETVTHERIPFIMSLAGGDTELYDDIMQSIAPLVMDRKPDGVIWWVGDGANGKSTLMDALYRIFPGQLSSLTVKRLTDARDTPSLNGTLANIVKESSEGRIEDTEIYKAVGTHEDFRVHKFHSQDDVEIRGNLHHIFSGNSVPTFNDKGFSARRRTFIIPFAQVFQSDPSFEQRTFTPELFCQLVTEMCRYAKQIERQGFRYKWSAATLAAKGDYDVDANTAEEYAKHLISQGVVGFEGFSTIKMDYENWCADEGYVPLGITNLRRALGVLGFERFSTRDDSGTMRKMYRQPSVKPNDLQLLSPSKPGMYTVVGFTPAPVVDERTVVPEFKEEAPAAPTKTSILNGKW